MLILRVPNLMLHVILTKSLVFNRDQTLPLKIFKDLQRNLKNCTSDCTTELKNALVRLDRLRRGFHLLLTLKESIGGSSRSLRMRLRYTMELIWKVEHWGVDSLKNHRH